MSALNLILLLIAAICAVVALLGIPARVNLVAVGLALVVAALLITELT